MDLLAGDDVGRGERLRVLHEDPAFAPFEEYIAGFDPAMVDFLAAVARKWGRRRGG
jgi:hypothetical protein